MSTSLSENIQDFYLRITAANPETETLPPVSLDPAHFNILSNEGRALNVPFKHRNFYVEKFPNIGERYPEGFMKQTVNR